MAGDLIWEDSGLCTLKNHLNISSQADLFYTEKTNVGNGFGIQGEGLIS